MARIFLGIFKGLLVGTLIGATLFLVGVPFNFINYIACAAAGALAGLICGKAPWKANTFWTPLLKAIAGAGLGIGVFVLAQRYIPGLTLPLHIANIAPPKLNSAIILSPAIGLLYGLFIELDDGGQPSEPADSTSLPEA